jgi:hypothetical protein
LPSLAYPLHGFGLCCSRREGLDMSQRLTAIPRPFGPRCLHVLLAALSGFFGVPGRLGLVARPSVISCPISSRRSDVFLAAFCGLLGMLLPLLAHACPPSLRVLFAVSTRESPSRTRTSVARSANVCGAAWDASGCAGEGASGAVVATVRPEMNAVPTPRPYLASRSSPGRLPRSAGRGTSAQGVCSF